MSRSNPVDETWERFSLLRSVYPLIRRSLPQAPSNTVDVEYFQHRPVTASDTCGDTQRELDNHITILRFEINTLPEILDEIDIHQLTKSDDIERVAYAFDSLLNLFEDSVVVDTGHESQADTHECFDFPKLTTLRNLRLVDVTKTLDQDDLDYNAKPSSSEQWDSAIVNGGLRDRLELPSLPYCIRFPTPQNTLEDCSHVVACFRKTIIPLFPGTARAIIESQLQEFEDTEIASIRGAYEFSEISSTLFSLLETYITCQSDHVATLHLSGFLKRKLEMLLSTCHDAWVPVCFAHHISETSNISPSLPGFRHRMCPNTITSGHDKPTIQACFDGTKVWENGLVGQALWNNDAMASPSTLDQFLGHNTNSRPGQSIHKLSRAKRATISLFLACSLYQLCGSPWIQDVFNGSNILILEGKTSPRNFDYWRPHISCPLRSQVDEAPFSRALSEEVAALGVLILELIANREAGWTEEDEDYDTEELSNRGRLSRILKDSDWRDELSDRYHDVGSACLNFQQLVEGFDHPSIEPHLRELAILYKCIVNPLHQYLVSDYSAATPLFNGISGLSVPSVRDRAAMSKRLQFFDDEDMDSSAADTKSRYAGEWIRGLEDGFVRNIRALRLDKRWPLRVGLAGAQCGKSEPKRIRVAILDTGIDESDQIIKGATRMSRIIKKRSWVGIPEDYCDRYGHGTHVARLFLQLAPSAELCVAKIADGKDVDPNELKKIADAIDWAVEKWDADIISMSFGFDGETNCIDQAVERALKADKLVFAAACNGGGNKKRSRPARTTNVLCIHASDGNGNKGEMSPNPMKNRDNFTFLGVGLKSQWKRKEVFKSGTSFATPIASAIAAGILEFANYNCELSDDDRRKLYRSDGMGEILKAMAQDRDGYDYVQPGYVWNGRENKEIAKIIKDILCDI